MAISPFNIDCQYTQNTLIDESWSELKALMYLKVETVKVGSKFGVKINQTSTSNCRCHSIVNSQYSKCLGIYNYDCRMGIDHLWEEISQDIQHGDQNGIVGIQPSLGMTPQVLWIFSWLEWKVCTIIIMKIDNTVSFILGENTGKFLSEALIFASTKVVSK